MIKVFFRNNTTLDIELDVRTFMIKLQNARTNKAFLETEVAGKINYINPDEIIKFENDNQQTSDQNNQAYLNKFRMNDVTPDSPEQLRAKQLKFQPLISQFEAKAAFMKDLKDQENAVINQAYGRIYGRYGGYVPKDQVVKTSDYLSKAVGKVSIGETYTTNTPGQSAQMFHIDELPEDVQPVKGRPYTLGQLKQATGASTEEINAAIQSVTQPVVSQPKEKKMGRPRKVPGEHG